MSNARIFRCFNASPEIIRLAVTMGTLHRRSQRVASALRGLIGAGAGDFPRLFGFV